METPLLDNRSAAEVVDEALVLAKDVYLPLIWKGFDASKTPVDPAFQLIGIFGRLMEVLIERLNRVPEKNFLAFLDMVGVEPSPGAPAAVPVTFLPSPKALEGGFIPAGTQVATTQTEQADAQVFETRTAIYATPALLLAALNLLPGEDKYSIVPVPTLPPKPQDFALIAGAAGSGPVGSSASGSGVEANESTVLGPSASGLLDLPHTLYLGSATLFGRKEVLDVTLRFTIASGDLSLMNSANLSWRRFDKDKKDWVETGVTYPPAPAGEVLAVLSLFGGNEKTQVAGVEDFWVSCSFEGAFPPAGTLPVLGGIAGALKPAGAALSASAIPDKAFANGNTLDISKPFSPFGERPRYGDALYLASAKALAPEVEEVTLTAVLKGYTQAQLEAAFRTIVAATTVTTVIQWQYLAGDGLWKPLAEFTHTLTATPGSPPTFFREVRRDGAVTTTEEGSFFGTVGSALSEFTFARPADMAFAAFQGTENHWIRALIKSEEPYGKDAFVVTTSPLVMVGSTLIPPVIEEVKLSFTYKSAFEALPGIVTENNLRRIDHGPGGILPVYPIKPFVAPEEQGMAGAAGTVAPAMALTGIFAGGHGLYLGFDRPFGDVYISCYFRLRDNFPSVDQLAESGKPLLAWEYLAQDEAWKALDVEDETAHLTSSGTVAFVGPMDALASDLFQAGVPPHSQSLYWFRARLASGDYDYPPVLRGVYPNTVLADNRNTFRGDLILGSGSGERHQALSLPKAPVLAGSLWVREVETPPTAELQILRDELLADGVDLGAAMSFVAIPLTGTGTVVTPETNAWSDILEIREFTDGREREAWVLWRRVPNFLASGPRNRHYTLDSLSGVVTLGDGIQALMPPVGKDNLLFRGFQTGGGETANEVALPLAVKELKSSLPYVDKVFNVEAASGGSNPWGLEEILGFGPQLIKNKERAVSAEDFEWMTLQYFSSLARAKCLSTRAPGPTGLVFKPGAVTMVVVPKSQERFPRPASALLEAIRDYLVGQALGGIISDIHVLGPGFTEVTVTAEVHALDPRQNSEVERRCLKALEDFFHPLYGGEDGTGWAFGRDVVLSEVYAVLQRVEGVDFVASAAFLPSPGGPMLPLTALGALDIGENNLVGSGAHTIGMV